VIEVITMNGNGTINGAVSHVDPWLIVANARVNRVGFLLESDVAALASHTEARLWPVLVRCGGCRFTAPAQDVAHLIGIIRAEGSDYVRDVALVAGEVYGRRSQR
jgi:hypothetical protein